MSRASCAPAAIRLAAALAAALGAGLCGCGPHAQIVLDQPFAPPGQRHLRLAGDTACRAAAGGRQSCVLTFPLPGAERGPRAFVLYLSAPDRCGDLAVDPADPAAVRGFLIQELGALAGRTDCIAGAVRCRPVWLRPDLRQLELDLRCADGTGIRGSAVLAEAPPAVQRIERQLAADIELLSGPPPRPDDGAAAGRTATAR